MERCPPCLGIKADGPFAALPLLLMRESCPNMSVWLGHNDDLRTLSWHVSVPAGHSGVSSLAFPGKPL